MPKPLRIGVLIGAEPYQIYHVSEIAAALASRPDVQVELIATLPESLEEWDRVKASEPVVPTRLLHTPIHLRILQRLLVLGSLKTLVMRNRRNVEMLSSYDAIVTPTDHARVIRGLVPDGLALVYVNHGLGGRAAAYSEKYRNFDFVIVASRDFEQRLLEKRLIRQGHYAIAYTKFEAAQRLAERAPDLFANDRPVVLFNAHSKKSLRSWERFALPLIEHATRTGEFNLIVAPHVKMFRRRPKWLWRKWEHLSVPGRVIVDLGSRRSLDMSYTNAADIYAGDVSSQVYEFLTDPKPCVFLNAHGIDWRGNDDFPLWDLGDVAETPEQAIEAIRGAFERHPLYERRQHERIAATIDRTPGAAARAADAIIAFMRT